MCFTRIMYNNSVTFSQFSYNNFSNSLNPIYKKIQNIFNKTWPNAISFWSLLLSLQSRAKFHRCHYRDLSSETSEMREESFPLFYILWQKNQKIWKNSLLLQFYILINDHAVKFLNKNNFVGFWWSFDFLRAVK